MATPIESGEVQGDPGSVEGTPPESTPGPNPAWGEALSAIPEQFHETLTSHWQKWDQSAQSRIEQANQSVAQFDPFKPFIENNISADDLEQGLQLMYQLNTNPQAVYEALAEAYNLGPTPNASQEIEGEEEEETPPNFQDPRFDQLQSGLELVANTLLQQEQAKIQRQADAEVDSELAALKQQHPNLDEKYVLALMVNGFTAEQAGNHWGELTQNILQQNPRPFAPQVMGSSGGGAGLPSQAIDPVSLNDKDRRALVVQMLNAANSQT